MKGEFSIIARKKKERREHIKIIIVDNKICIEAECDVLKQLGQIKCDKDCKSCWCG